MFVLAYHLSKNVWRAQGISSGWYALRNEGRAGSPNSSFLRGPPIRHLWFATIPSGKPDGVNNTWLRLAWLLQSLGEGLEKRESASTPRKLLAFFEPLGAISYHGR
ncbi:hypothetical protein SH449x_001249 [Pirellulaceae bacterium SH449]